MRTKIKINLISLSFLFLILLTSVSADFNAQADTQVLANTCMRAQSELVITNSLSASQVISLSTSGRLANFVRFSANSVQFQPKETKKILVYYDIPCGFKPKSYDLDIFFTGYNVEKQLTQEVVVQQLDSLVLKTENASMLVESDVPEKIEFLLILDNPSGITEIYEFSIDETYNYKNVDIELVPDRVTLQSEERAEIRVLFNADNTVSGNFGITVRAKAQKTLQEKILPLELIIKNTNILLMGEGVSNIKTNYEKSSAEIKLRNTGESSAEYLIVWDGPEWVSVFPSEIFLESGEQKELQIILEPDLEVEKGNYNLSIIAKTDKTEYVKELKIRLRTKFFYEKYPVAAIIIVIVFLAVVFGAVGLVCYSKTASFKKKVSWLKNKIKEYKKKQEKKEQLRKKKEDAEKNKRAQDVKRKESELQRKKEQEQRKREQTQKKVEKEFQRTHHVIPKEQTVRGKSQGLKENIKKVLLLVVFFAIFAVLLLSARLIIENWDFALLGLIVLVLHFIIQRFSKTRTKIKFWKIITKEDTVLLWKKGILAVTPRIKKPVENLKLIIKKIRPFVKPSSKVFQSFVITANIEDLQDFKITLKVPKSWLRKIEEPVLAKLQGHRWFKTSIMKSGEDDKNVYFAATIEQGVYSIYGKPVKKVQKKESGAKLSSAVFKVEKPEKSKAVVEIDVKQKDKERFEKKKIKKQGKKTVQKKKKSVKFFGGFSKLIIAIIFFTVLTLFSALTMPVQEKGEGIPSQFMSPGETTAINLNKYFYDPDGDELIYSVTQTENFIVEFDDGFAFITSEEGWFGEVDVIFTAMDLEGETAESNVVVLRSVKRPISLNKQKFLTDALAVVTIMLMAVLLLRKFSFQKNLNNKK